MKNAVSLILAAVLAATGNLGLATQPHIQAQSTVADVWYQPPASDDVEPIQADSENLLGIELDKTVYSTEDTIKVDLCNYPWDAEPSATVEIIWLETDKTVFYGTAREESLDIHIGLHPGDYLLRVHNSADAAAYWDRYWNAAWDENWEEDWNNYWAQNSSSVQFSVAGTSDLLRLSGSAGIETSSGIEVSARLEWSGPSEGGGPYTVTRRNVRDSDGEVILVDNSYVTNFVDKEGLVTGGIYTYTVSDGVRTSNPIVINFSGLPPLEYVGNKNNKVLVLKVADPYIYSAEDKQSAMDGIGLKMVKAIDETDWSVTPEIINDRTLVPIASLVEEIGGTVDWDGATRVITIHMADSVTMQDNILEIPVGSKTVYFNGAGKTFDTSAQIKHSRTMVPVRLLELLGCDVEWVSDSQSIVLYFWGGEDIG